MPTNEKSESRVKSMYWLITSFEVNPPSFDDWNMHAMRYGKEICPKTKTEHWHAAIQFKDYIRVKTVKHCFPKYNLAARKGNQVEFFAYCMKDGEYVSCGKPIESAQGERGDLADLLVAVDEGASFKTLMITHAKTVCRYMPYTKQLVKNRDAKIAFEKRKLKFDKPLREWQSELKTIVAGEVDDRSVYWYHDEAGGKGKSFMSGYLQTQYNAFIVSGGKVADIAHAYEEEPVVVFDLSRTMVDHCDHIYNIIEKFKDGCLFSGKYESHTKIFEPPHVIVFANFKPDLTKLSADRWRVFSI